jgi:sugar phosphate isomerase/epimerase
MLQLDVGTCVAAKADPVAWINANPGRIKSIHCKDWAAGTREPGTKQEARTGPNRPSNQSEIHQGPAESGSVVRASGSGDKGYRVLFGEGDSPWAKIFEAAESVGGVEYYLIEQEGSRYSSFETARRCMAAWKQMRG